MRRQAADPLHMLHVVSSNGWEDMRWDRIPNHAPRWNVHLIRTTHLTPDRCAAAVLAWIHSVLAGTTPSIRVTD